MLVDSINDAATVTLEDMSYYTGPHNPYGQTSRGSRGWAPSSQERTWAILGHLSAIIAMIISVGALGFIGPLVIWLIWKDRSPFVRRAAAGAFNFNLLISVMGFLALLLHFTVILAPLAWILELFAALSWILHIVGAWRASRGHDFRYPLAIHVLS